MSFVTARDVRGRSCKGELGSGAASPITQPLASREGEEFGVAGASENCSCYVHTPESGLRIFELDREQFSPRTFVFFYFPPARA